jgi:ATP-dependent Lhr-like helicase
MIRHLIDQGYIDSDSDMLYIGPEAERRFGHRHFMGMTAVFVGAPEFTVLVGRDELGRVDPALLTEEVQGDRRLLLNGRSWRVTYIDWPRRRCFVEPAEGGGKARWMTGGWAGLGFELSRAMREVILGADPPVRLTQRAVTRLATEREERSSLVHPGGSVILRDREGDDLRWWTWAGFRANATLAVTLTEVVDPVQRFDDYQVRLRANLTREDWRTLVADADQRLCLPDVNKKALDGLKFSEALPERLALATLASRLADLDGAAAVLREPTRFVHI